MPQYRMSLGVLFAAMCLLDFCCTKNEDIFRPASHPELKIDGPNPLAFGETTDNRIIKISTGSGEVAWKATADKPWLRIVPDAGIATGSVLDINVNVDRTGLSPGSYAGTVTLTSDWGNPTLGVTMEIPAGTWMQYDDNSFSDGTTLITTGWLWTRFQRPQGWNSTRVTKVQIYLYKGSSYSFDIDGFDSYTLEEGKYYYPSGSHVSLKKSASQSIGWQVHDVNNIFTGDNFFIAAYIKSGYSNYIGHSFASDSIYVSGYKTSSSNSCYTYKVWGLRIFVEPGTSEAARNTGDCGNAGCMEEKNGRGIWLEADPVLNFGNNCNPAAERARKGAYR